MLLAIETDDVDNVEGNVRDVEVEVSDSNEGDGEILGRGIEGGAAVIVVVMGSPSSFMKLRILVKSASL